MAEWNPSLTYSPGAIVTYGGLTYVRSYFPAGATGGTNPKEELSTDTFGQEIRTWILDVKSPSIVPYPFNIGYYRLKQISSIPDGTYIKQPPLTDYPGKATPIGYAGASDEQTSAYGAIATNLGWTVDMDQAADAAPPQPAFPQIEASSCGVAMQQYQGVSSDPVTIKFAGAETGISIFVNLTYNSTTQTWYEDSGARPRVSYAFLIFNHPLFFRRTHTLYFRISTYTYADTYEIPGDPPIVVPGTFEGIYSTSTQAVIPTDNNYNISRGGDYVQPANAVATYTLPNDETNAGPYGSTTGTIYTLEGAGVLSVEVND